jgi:hypothetical protein
MPRWQSIRDRVIYKLDTFLGFPPIVQTLSLLLGTVLLVGAWALALRFAAPAQSGDAVWWSLARFFDGGTMAGDTGRVRLVSIGVTATGVLMLSFLTAAFASKMAERIQDLRSGRGPVRERDHLLVLGFDAKVALIARELARGDRVRTLVVLAPMDKDRMDLALRPARRLARQLRIVARTGDPRSAQALRRVSADRARAIVVVPPEALGDDASVPWSLATLLAIRRADFAGHVVVESRHGEARELLLLAGEPDVVGKGALRTEVVSSDEVIAKILGQAARQEGLYFTLRRLLSFRECGLFVEQAPEALVGKTFEEAHARVHGAIPIGVCRPGEPPVVNPFADSSPVLRATDGLLLVGSAPGAWGVGAPAHEPARAAPLASPPGSATPERIVLLGWNRTIGYVVRQLDELLPAGSQVTIVSAGGGDEAALHRTRGPATKHVELAFDRRRPSEVARDADPVLADASAVLILGDDDSDGGDAAALTTLLWLRSGMHRAKRRLRRIVTEVRDPRSASYVAELAHDFIVSNEVVAMLLAHEALSPVVAPAYRELMSPEGNELFIRPLAAYVDAPESGGGARFAHVAAVARARGEIAIGLLSPGGAWPDGHSPASGAGDPVWLNPPADTRLAASAELRVIVVARP